MIDAKAYPVRKWVVRLDDAPVDEAMACEGWMLLIRAQGWSPVGEPEVVSRPQYGEHAVYGRVVQYPGITVDASIDDAIRIPA